jgi:hypothetical protein
LFSNEETNSALKISTEYLINKQKELQSVQSLKSVDGNKLIMTRNEQRKLNQNSIAEKVEAMNQKEIDHQLTASLTSIKREKSLILDKYLELEAIKFYYSKKNIPSSLKSNKTRVIKSAPAEDMHTSEDGVPVNIEFLNKDYANLQNKLTDFYGKKYELLPARQKMSAPASFRSYMDCIRDKFREQNSRYFPNYKKKSKDLKISLTYDDLVKDLGAEIQMQFKTVVGDIAVLKNKQSTFENQLKVLTESVQRNRAKTLELMAQFGELRRASLAPLVLSRERLAQLQLEFIGVLDPQQGVRESYLESFRVLMPICQGDAEATFPNAMGLDAFQILSIEFGLNGPRFTSR